MTILPFAGAQMPGLQAATPEAGSALVNGTPDIITWTTPNDGKLHFFSTYVILDVTSAATGGEIDLHAPSPNGIANSYLVLAANQGAGIANAPSFQLPVGPGQTIRISQGSALTAGAALVWAGIFGA